MRCVTLSVLVAAAVLASCSEPAAPRDALSAESAPSIQIIDLGTVPGGARSEAYGISPNGLIAGSSADLVNSGGHPVIWNHGVLQYLGSPGDYGEAYGVRFDGMAVGRDLRLNRAVRWSGGQVTVLPGLLGGNLSIARAINANGLIVGQSNRATVSGAQRARAVRWKDGVVKDLGTLGGKASSAFAINQAGKIVGYSNAINGDAHGFVWDHGTMTDLGALPGCGSAASAINDSSDVVGTGWGSIASGCNRALLWKRGQVIALGTLPGDISSGATGINRSGDIVGWSGDGPGYYIGMRAFRWRQGVMTDLGTLPGGDFSTATAISTAGEIVGYSTSATGQWHAVKWVVK
jgi:probable HAF family extracellular repeat protein